MKKEKQVEQMVDKNQNIFGCTPYCIYFPNSECVEWVYDEKNPYIKRRKDNKKFVCKYDGHVIVSWTDEICPKKVDRINKETEEI